MNKERISYLLKVYQQQTATADERAEFAKIIHDKNNDALFGALIDPEWDAITVEEIAELHISSYDSILQDIKAQPQVPVRKSWWPQIAIAAAILVSIFGICRYYLAENKNSRTDQFANDIAPGKKGATLTLADGRKILIKDMLAGDVAYEAGVKITKTKSGVLTYEVIQRDEGTVTFNTLATTKGEEIQVQLQDGTVVYLNSESSLKYPVSFNESKRQVILTGEGYFEVAKDKQHPFLISTSSSDIRKGQSVEVLGTTFNINSYADEPSIKTTLVEGSVRIYNLAINDAKVIKPGEQATVNGTGTEIKEVEIDDVVAWKNGYFMFDNETLEHIMKKVARWYDIEVVYKDESIKRKTFFGSVSRFKNVSELLKLLQKTGGATFEIKGQQIIVGQKN